MASVFFCGKIHRLRSRFALFYYTRVKIKITQIGANVNGLSIAVVIIIAAFTFGGYHRGFLKTAVSMIFYVLTIALVMIVTPHIGKFIQEKTPLYEIIKDKFMDTYRVQETETGEEKEYQFMDFIEAQLLEGEDADLYSVMQIKEFQEYICDYIAKLIINAVAFISTLILIVVFLKVTVLTLDIITSLPVIKGANKIAGIFLGFGEGILVVWLLFLIIIVFSSSTWGSKLFAQIAENPMLLFLSNHNYLLRLIISF